MSDIKKNEGFSGSIYKDTLGNETIGYGFNLNDSSVRKMIPKDVLSGKRELTKPEAEKIYNELYSRAEGDSKAFLGNAYTFLSPSQKSAIIDMAYNLGRTKLMKFKKLKKAIVDKDYKRAAEEIKNSKYYKQVSNRAKRNMSDIMDIGGKVKILRGLR